MSNNNNIRNSNVQTDQSNNEELPYNPLNKLVTEEEVNALLGDVTKVKDINIYRKAFVHRSYCTRKNENFLIGNLGCPTNCLPLQEESNERLEFLGDAVVNLVVARYLFFRYPDENEGFMTRIRTRLVCGTQMAHFAGIIGLEKHLMISKQIEDNQGRHNLNLLEDCFEAFIGAILNDQGTMGDGYEVAEAWIVNLIETNIDFSDLIANNTNYKDQAIKAFLHNFNVSLRFQEISVDSTSSGGKKYTICVKGQGDAILGIGIGQSKKIAENDAARVVLANMKN